MHCKKPTLRAQAKQLCVLRGDPMGPMGYHAATALLYKLHVPGAKADGPTAN